MLSNHSEDPVFSKDRPLQSLLQDHIEWFVAMKTNTCYQLT